MPKLVIVESPCQGKDHWQVSGPRLQGHGQHGAMCATCPPVRWALMSKNGYKPKYITIKGKQKLVKELKAEAKKCDGVLLATDPDREGEAISWHLANILGAGPRCAQPRDL